LAVVAGTVIVLGLLRTLLHRGIRASLAAPRIEHDRTPADFGLPFETLRIDTANGRRVHAWLVSPAAGCAAPAPAVVVMHGWGGNASMMLPLARPLHDAGFAALYLDARCHGASDDDSFASLPRFAEDLEHALDWLEQHGGIDPARIGVIGHSVGAGAALLAASRRPGLAAVVSVSAFSHPAAMMGRWMEVKRIPARTVGRYILGYVQRTIGHRFDDIAPVATIARIRCPVLLVHGAADEVVPPSEAREIFAARADADVELRLVEGFHDSFSDFDRHMQDVIAFLGGAMQGGVASAPLRDVSPPRRRLQPAIGNRSGGRPAPWPPGR